MDPVKLHLKIYIWNFTQNLKFHEKKNQKKWFDFLQNSKKHRTWKKFKFKISSIKTKLKYDKKIKKNKINLKLKCHVKAKNKNKKATFYKIHKKTKKL